MSSTIHFIRLGNPDVTMVCTGILRMFFFAASSQLHLVLVTISHKNIPYGKKNKIRSKRALGPEGQALDKNMIDNHILVYCLFCL